VVARREATALHYRLADPRVARLLVTLRALFCEPPGRRKERAS
jgi:DNA-binding transcriptional ArsR family regulator